MLFFRFPPLSSYFITAYDDDISHYRSKFLFLVILRRIKFSTDAIIIEMTLRCPSHELHYRFLPLFSTRYDALPRRSQFSFRGMQNMTLLTCLSIIFHYYLFSFSHIYIDIHYLPESRGLSSSTVFLFDREISFDNALLLSLFSWRGRFI